MEIDYKSFIELLENGTRNDDDIRDSKIDTIPSYLYENHAYKEKDKFHGLCIKWRIGGLSSAGWDDSEPKRVYEKSDETEPPFKDLIKVLKYICPDIKLLQYKELEFLMKNTSWTSDKGYYGETSDYECKYIDLKDVFEFLEENDLLSEEFKKGYNKKFKQVF